MELVNYITKANFAKIKEQKDESINMAVHCYSDCLSLNRGYHEIPNSGFAALKFNSRDQRNQFLRESKCRWFYCTLCKEKMEKDLAMKEMQGEEQSALELNAKIIPIAFKNWLNYRLHVENIAKQIGSEEYQKESDITENEKKKWHAIIGDSILLQI